VVFWVFAFFTPWQGKKMSASTPLLGDCTLLMKMFADPTKINPTRHCGPTLIRKINKLPGANAKRCPRWVISYVMEKETHPLVDCCSALFPRVYKWTDHSKRPVLCRMAIQAFTTGFLGMGKFFFFYIVTLGKLSNICTHNFYIRNLKIKKWVSKMENNKHKMKRR
jgi:hypothetical protein